MLTWIRQSKSQALTQTGRLLPLDLCQFGDGVRAVTLREDARQLLADHLILTKHRQRNKTSEGEESCLGGQRSANIQEFMLRKNTSTYFSAPLSYTKTSPTQLSAQWEGFNFLCSLVSHSALILPRICGYLTPLKGDQMNIRLISHTLSPSEINMTGLRKTTFLLCVCVWC